MINIDSGFLDTSILKLIIADDILDWHQGLYWIFIRNNLEKKKGKEILIMKSKQICNIKLNEVCKKPDYI